MEGIGRSRSVRSARFSLAMALKNLDTLLMTVAVGAIALNIFPTYPIEQNRTKNQSNLLTVTFRVQSRIFKGARLRYFRQFQHWTNCHRINLNIKITAQNYRRTRTKHSKDKKGRGWTKLERIEVDCIWINLKNVGPPFFKFTVCQFIHVSNFH